ncbi:hypothetical protein N7539_006838 [Penicillium diatomitis]|uniref:F-box domain-containing protein n=1 Tax=Penicillium diatomitis TaxID=2819901 RepID=A0A9W9X219_9EURO|nr:uncharacterized protein N7539_006838 [Penicillium diatomitis]KAJ5480944.1 hypothetical protein N7539_006838 [Penicillium diatomitis]
MDIDLDDQAIIRRFKTLPKQRRAVILHGILDTLSSDEWRDVKCRGETTLLLCDIVGKLPTEIAALIIVCLPLVDIVRLRRVSHRWRVLLSSPHVCRRAVRATLEKDPWDSNICTKELELCDHLGKIFHTGLALGDDLSETSQDMMSPSPNACPYTDCAFRKIALQRYCQEKGRPLKRINIRAPNLAKYGFHSEHEDWMVYSDGRLAWVDVLDTSRILTVHLDTGVRRTFMTENRDEILRICMVRPLLAAITIRGYCVVWNVDTEEESSFRLPSLDQCVRIVISGTKVAVALKDSAMVHWCSRRKVSTSFQSPSRLAALSVHPSLDQITLVRLLNENIEIEGELFPEVFGRKINVTTYTMNDTQKWRVLSSKNIPVPSSVFLAEDSYLHHVHKDKRMLTPGCSSSRLTIAPLVHSTDTPKVCFIVVEPSGLVAFHTLKDKQFSPLGLVSYIEKGIIYAENRLGKRDLHAPVVSAKPSIQYGPQDSYVWYDWKIDRRVSRSWGKMVILGDRRYVIILNCDCCHIWCFEDSVLRDEIDDGQA